MAKDAIEDREIRSAPGPEIGALLLGLGAIIGGILLKDRRRARTESLESEEYAEAAALAGSAAAGAAASG